MKRTKLQETAIAPPAGIMVKALAEMSQSQVEEAIVEEDPGRRKRLLEMARRSADLAMEIAAMAVGRKFPTPLTKRQVCRHCNGEGAKDVADGQAMRRAREASGESMTSIAKSLGCSLSFVSDIERGVARCPDRVLKLYIEKYVAAWEAARKAAKRAGA